MEKNATITVTAGNPQAPRQAVPEKTVLTEQKAFVIHRVEKIHPDNPVFFKLREVVYQLDDQIFNRKGSAGPGYQPTRFSMILPFWAGLVAAGYYVYASFAGAEDKVVTYNFVRIAVIMLVINLPFSCWKKVRTLPGRKRKIFYPVFIAVVSLLTFCIITFLAVWLSAIILFIFVLMLLPIALRSGMQTGTSSSDGSSAPPAVVEEKWLDDGSVTGLKITREGGVGNWYGSDGHTYTEGGSGGYRRT